ncbi:MAG TPA: hypothetical protein VGV14_09040, partial [Rhodanobacter sp.]|nr:hypothetical protein [Rhodanobacter sp.]
LVVIATKASSGSSWSFSIYVSGTLFMANSGLPGATITDLTLDIGRGLSARKYYSTVFLNRAITPTEIAAVSAAALA